MPDERTANREYLLPNPGHTLAVDVNRLRAALVQIDADVAANLIADAARSILIGNNALAASATSTEVTALKAEPIFTGNGSVPNQAVSINSSSIANTKFVQDVVAARLFLQGFINGLITAQNATTPNTHIDIGVGAAWTGDRIIQNVATFTKRLDAIWLAGSGNGGLFSGARAANTWYHLFVLRNDTTGVIDFGFDTSVSAANRPAGWAARIIWSVRTDASSNIIPYSQVGDLNLWATPPVDISNLINIPSTGTLYTVSSPLGLSCPGIYNLVYSGSTFDFLYLSSPAQNNDAADFLGSRMHVQGGGQLVALARIYLTTNTSSQIRIRATAVSSNPLYMNISQFQHPRGRLI